MIVLSSFFRPAFKSSISFTDTLTNFAARRQPHNGELTRLPIEADSLLVSAAAECRCRSVVESRSSERPLGLEKGQRVEMMREKKTSWSRDYVCWVQKVRGAGILGVGMRWPRLPENNVLHGR